MATLTTRRLQMLQQHPNTISDDEVHSLIDELLFRRNIQGVLLDQPVDGDINSVLDYTTAYQCLRVSVMAHLRAQGWKHVRHALGMCMWEKEFDGYVTVVDFDTAIRMQGVIETDELENQHSYGEDLRKMHAMFEEGALESSRTTWKPE